ncbi:MAG: head-tail connector protein [Bacteroides xylanisolvens]|uniref:head-tail connector protein n=1 Tax=Bacteroides graminisolvens TaxID=477666 RepID=UPI0029C82318|nr:head-tail connector protein [Bacteroides graminisolvens]
MEYVTVEELKKHLNIDFSDDDAYLTDILKVAMLSIETTIKTPLEEYVKGGEFNPMLKHAIKILAGNFYANREPVSFAAPSVIPYSLSYLIRPFKKYQ